MNRRDFLTMTVGSAVALGTPSFAIAQTPEERDALFGNAFDYLPEGTTDDVEIVAETIEESGWDIALVIRNNSSETVYLSDIVGMVRSEDGTPLATPSLASIAPTLVKAGEYAIAKIILSDSIEDPSTAVLELDIKTESIENTFNHWYSNVTVTEASPTNGGIIGQVENTTGKTPPGSNWLVVAVSFDDEGNLLSGGMDFQHSTQEFNQGGSQVFNAHFNEEPTGRFIVSAVATIT